MTPEQKAKLDAVAAEVCRIFPDFYGSVKFNVAGGKCPNINVEESIRIPQQQ
jgi:hypothetical protein